MKLIKLITKNFKVLFRNKSSTLVLILGPLLLIGLVGLAFNNNTNISINLGYYTPEKNELVDSYLSQIDNTTYSLKEFTTPEECIENIKLASIHTCIKFPANFSLENNKVNNIIFYVDESKLNLVDSIINKLSSTISLTSTNLSLELTNNILDVMTFTKDTMNYQIEKQDNISKSVSVSYALSKELQENLDKNNINTNKVDGSSGGSGSYQSISDDLKKEIEEQMKISRKIHTLWGDTIEVIDSSSNQSRLDELELIYYDQEYSNLETGKIVLQYNDTENTRLALLNSINSLTSSVTELIEDIDKAENIQEDVERSLRKDLDPVLLNYQDDIKLLQNQNKDIITLINNVKVSNADNIINPVKTTVEKISSKDTKINFLFPNLVVLFIMFISILIPSNLLLMEKKSKAYFRNFTTPTNDYLFIISSYLTGIILVFLQSFVILSGANLFFKIPYFSNFWLVSLLLLIISSVFTFLGMVIGYTFNSEETVMIGSISLISLFLLVSDLILPLESLPKYVMGIAKLNPFVIGSEALKQILLFNMGIISIYGYLIILSILAIIILIFMVFIQQFMKYVYLRSFENKNIVKFDKKINIKNYFKINNEAVTTPEGLIRVLKHMNDQDFKTHINKRNNIISRWVLEVLKNAELADKIRTKNKKEDIIFLLKRSISIKEVKDNKKKE